jgi:isocitrate dehydrogenase
MFHESRSTQRVGTRAFAEAVIARLGLRPQRIAAVDYPEREPETLVHPDTSIPAHVAAIKQLVGVDVFLNWDDAERTPGTLGTRLEALAGPEFRLALITNRGVKVYPQGLTQTLCTDHWRCRFPASEGRAPRPQDVAALLLRLAEAGLDAVKTENLYTFDGVRGYSQAQGE